jgi:uncharacterized protein (TIGR02246 family)
MKVPRLVFAPALAMLIGTACAPPSPPSDTAQDRAEIEAIIADYEQAINDGDLDGSVAIFSPDAVFMPNGGRTQRGIDAIRAYYQNTILQSPLQLAFNVDDVEVVGDLAWATAAIVGTQTAADGTENPVAVNGLFVFGRDAAGGSWHVVAYPFTPSVL